MKSKTPTFRAALLLAALLTFSAALLAADPATPASVTPTPETALHEIGAAPTPTAVPTPTPEPSQRVHQYNGNSDDRVSVGDSTSVGPDETIPGNAVAVMGSLTVDGTVDGNAVCVLGSNTINGTVHGNVVVVLGELRIGSHAHIDGNAVAAGGIIFKEPGAYVGGNTVQQGSKFSFTDNSEASNWWTHGLRMGRPLALGHHLHVFWLINACFVVLYVILALVFPEGTRKCGDTLVKRPGITFLTGVLAMIALPVVFVLLCITIVGIPVALIILPLAVLSCVVFGRASLYALVGRSILGKDQHPALAVLVGALVVMAVYLIPVVGLGLWVVVGFLGFACALTTLMAPAKTAAAAAVPPVVPAAPVAPVPPAPSAVPQEAAVVPPEIAPLLAPPSLQSVAAAPAPPPIPAALAQASEAALPRAGFWIRMVALLIDAILIGAVTQMSHVVLPLLAAYGAVLWKYKGATIGGIIFGIKVVRLDSKPVDWMTSVVRALACFLSLIALGLGFIWIAFDAEKQGWHDKIAGTVVVRLPKGASLV
jgi:uncharacterized RDD family membrane protein YckC